MRKKRWLKVVGGAIAILVVVVAAAWVVMPDRTTPAQRGGVLSPGSASLGPTPSGASAAAPTRRCPITRSS